MIEGEYIYIDYSTILLYIPSEMKEPSIATMIGTELFFYEYGIGNSSIKRLSVFISDILTPEKPSDIFTAALVTRKLIQ